MKRRSSKACEQCRKIKRRCQPPFPCSNCLSKGFVCQVRERARPGRIPRRTRAPTKASLSPPPPPPPLLESKPSSSQDAYSLAAAPQEWISGDQAGPSRPSTADSPEDPGEILQSMTSEYARAAFGLEFALDLREPKMSIFPAARPASATNAQDYLRLLSDTANLRVRLGVLNNQLAVYPKYVDTRCMIKVASRLRDMIARVSSQSQELSLSELLLESPSDDDGSDVGLDTAALLFGALALGSCYNFQDLEHTNWLFAESTSLSGAYTGPPTPDLLDAQFSQHCFLLGTGSGNQAKTLIVQAIHTANHVGLGQARGVNAERSSQRALLAYLLVNFADQYCAMDHRTAPIIRAEEVDYSIFDRLVETDAKAQQFVKLLKLNGLMLESIYNQTNKMTVKEVMRLEAMIGEACLGIPIRPKVGVPGSYNNVCSFGSFPQLIQIHMFWCRIILRAPLLRSKTSWVTSISVCSRAAQMILSLYLDIFQPGIMEWAGEMEPISQVHAGGGAVTPSQLLIIDYKIPPTWRQVKRIIISALIVALAYWRGELAPAEASRFLSVGLLLLHCQRTRWQQDLQGLVRGVLGLLEISGLDAKAPLANLLPGVDTATLCALTSWSWEAIHVIYRPSSPDDDTIQEGGRRS